MLCSVGKLWVVALRKESVDRNGVRYRRISFRRFVALRKESVDRNSDCPSRAYNARVALRKESVDRNAKNYNYC